MLYYIYYIISSTASAGQSGGYERPKCNGSYLGITKVMRWLKRNNHSEPRKNNIKTRMDGFIMGLKLYIKEKLKVLNILM